MNDLMLDLETMGKRVNAPVVSIGAVFFDRETGALGDMFEGLISVEDACRYGVPDGGTIAWWLKQSDEARRKIADATEGAQAVFARFDAFVRRNSTWNTLRPWGNGASFDISILDYAIPKITGKQVPWKYTGVRDCRTILDAGESFIGKNSLERKGTHHGALDDAIYQAEWVSWFWMRLREMQRLGQQSADEPPAPVDLFDL